MNQIKVKRIKELVEQLNYHRNLYYNESRSEISDYDYDNLFDELTNLEKMTGLVLSNSPTQTVGYEVKSGLTKVIHNHAMLSLDKTKSTQELEQFLGNNFGVLMLKLDGLTISLRYMDGNLVGAETRGDGYIGEDILHNAKVFSNIPLKIDYKDELIIDGEAIITYDNFEKINESLPEDERYKNPRNLASGSVRQLDSKIAAERNIKFIAWKMIKGSDDNSFNHRLDILSYLGFEVTPHCLVDKTLVAHTIDRFKEVAEHNKYPIDGMVLGYDDVAYGESLGSTGHHLKSQMAFKFADDLYETKLLNIEWTMGKTGVLTPTAVFEPVEIDGTTVERANLHNISMIKTLGLTNNCTVKTYKANQIIPQIRSCEQDGDGEIIIPHVCPICGGATAIQKDNDSEVLICTNDNCSGRLLGKMVNFVSRKGVNIDGLSEATLELLINKGYIKTFLDIYSLSEHKDKLIQLPGFGRKSVENLLLSIENSRKVKLSNYIVALGIPGVGVAAAKVIADYFNQDYYAFEEAMRDDFDWTVLPDFGQKTSDAINKWWDKQKEDIFFLPTEFEFEASPEISTDNSLADITFCITGSFTQSRDALKAQLEARGAKFVSSVSKNLDILFAGEKAGSKLKKAQELGIKVVNEAGLLEMLK